MDTALEPSDPLAEQISRYRDTRERIEMQMGDRVTQEGGADIPTTWARPRSS